MTKSYQFCILTVTLQDDFTGVDATRHVGASGAVEVNDIMGREPNVCCTWEAVAPMPDEEGALEIMEHGTLSIM